MKKWPVLSLVLTLALTLFCVGVNAQPKDGASIEAERLRISDDRARLNAAYALEDTACYQRFFVNNCLDQIKARRDEALADLRRQEIVLNEDSRKAKAAEQLQKTEDKSAPEKLQQEADKRAQAIRETADRAARIEQKTADREQLQTGEKANVDALAERLKSNQNKAAARAARQSQEAEALKKYNARQQQAKERQAEYAKENAKLNKTPASSLPVPVP